MLNTVREANEEERMELMVHFHISAWQLKEVTLRYWTDDDGTWTEEYEGSYKHINGRLFEFEVAKDWDRPALRTIEES